MHREAIMPLAVGLLLSVALHVAALPLAARWMDRPSEADAARDADFPPIDLRITSLTTRAKVQAGGTLHVSFIVNIDPANAAEVAGTLARRWRDEVTVMPATGDDGVDVGRPANSHAKTDVDAERANHDAPAVLVHQSTPRFTPVADGKYQVDITLTIPRDVPPAVGRASAPVDAAAAMTVVVRIDAGDDVQETNESNNRITAPLLIDPMTTPDLQVVALSVDPRNGGLDARLGSNTSDIVAGFPFAVRYRVQNTGGRRTGVADIWFDQLYLSRDGRLDADDLPLDEQASERLLQPGDRYQRIASNIIIDPTWAGLAYLIVIADGDGDLDEGNWETNNRRVLPVTIFGKPTPDLDAAAISGKKWLRAGDVGAFTYRIINRGRADADAPWIDRVWVSRDDQRSDDDVLIHEHNATMRLAAGSAYDVTFDVSPAALLREPSTENIGRVDDVDADSGAAPGAADDAAIATSATAAPPATDTETETATATSAGQWFLILETDTTTLLDERGRRTNNRRVARFRIVDEDEPLLLGNETPPTRPTVAWIAHDDFQKLLADREGPLQPALQREVDPSAEAPPITRDVTPPTPPTPASTASAAAEPSTTSTTTPVAASAARSTTSAATAPTLQELQQPAAAPSAASEAASDAEREAPSSRQLAADAADPRPRAEQAATLTDTGTGSDITTAGPNDALGAGQPTTAIGIDVNRASPAIRLPHRDSVEVASLDASSDTLHDTAANDPAAITRPREGMTAAGADPAVSPGEAQASTDDAGLPTQRIEVEASQDSLQIDPAHTDTQTDAQADTDERGQAARDRNSRQPANPSESNENSSTTTNQKRRQEDSKQTTPPSEPKTATDSQRPAPTSSAGDEARPTSATRDERESDQFAPLIDGARVKPGQVITAEGIEIITIAPRFSVVTQYTAYPRNPSVQVHFDRHGKVTSARFLRDTQYTSVDAPILTSLYRWRAKGRRLEELPKGFVVRIDLILVK